MNKTVHSLLPFRQSFSWLRPPVKFPALFVASLFFITFFSAADMAQTRDYLSEEEVEIIRDSQDIDIRIDVLTKMIDRRFAALGIEVGGWKDAGKASVKWGAVPAGTPTELFWDIARLLDKAVDDIDVIAERNGDALKQNRTEGELFPKAVRSLATASRRYIEPLQNSLKSTEDEKTRSYLLDAIDICQQIIEAEAKLPAESPDKMADKKKAEKKRS